ncbi:LOW QUALITY PROTEIN: hypothetical protein BRARA_J02248 [Brassica rapa]|uniref:RRM domain-containing protein n=1 Tax=Brassica campestris TaxID=3711 RepID=A0A397XMJ4_BRACM|nr:LOW QUALITY PROTEIN: hypothetical protein BRARA_J02248 [Brassica rapa]
MSPPTLDQLHTYHAQERVIFSKLVLQFSSSPSESLLVMATWFWLENFGFEDIFATIFALPDRLIASLANEAVSCFRCIESSDPPNGFDQIPLTSRYLQKQISLSMIYKYRYTAIAGIKTFLNTICSRIFSDILAQVLPYSSPPYFVPGFHPSLIIPGFPHPTFGNINVMRPDLGSGVNTFNKQLVPIPKGSLGVERSLHGNENDRTMFITFSRGFPVSQAEVKELFTNIFGEKCVVGVYMREDCVSSPNIFACNNDQQQSLFAKLVLDSVVTVDRILEGEKLQKFRINGKHIWARKYNDKKDGRTCFT